MTRSFSFAIIAILVALTACAEARAPGAMTARTVVLGGPWGQGQQGYGKERPRTIFNGGDPTGYVGKIRWRRWGGRKAIGSGVGDFVWPGQSVASGSLSTPATVAAYGRTHCNGRLVYSRLVWFFPKYGERFHASQGYHLCRSDVYPRYVEPHKRRCRNVVLGESGWTATDVTAYDVRCDKARAVIAGSGASAYAGGGRFRSTSYLCGSDGPNEAGDGSTPFWCMGHLGRLHPPQLSFVLQ